MNLVYIMSHNTFRKIVAVVGSAAIISIAIYGNYLPLKKSKTYLVAVRAADELAAEALQAKDIKKVEEALNMAALPLLIPSPIGQDELVRNVVGDHFLGFISAGLPPEPLIKFTERFYTPIIERGRSLNFSQDLYVLGLLMETVFVKTGNPEYLEAAEAYFEKGHEVGPRRPQFLYRLFEVNVNQRDYAQAKKFGEEILSYWPDKSVESALRAITKNQQPTSND
ncbi:MAG: hypothetical protein AAB686_01510 [Patescibacteria group bacterium]